MKKLIKNKLNLDLILFTILLLLIAFGQFQRIELKNNISFYVHEILMLEWMIYSFFNQKKDWQKFFKKIKTKNFKLEIITLGWFGLGVLLAILRSSYSLKAFLYLLRIVFYLIFAVNLYLTKKRLIWQNSKKIISINLIRPGFIYAGLLVMLTGFLQYWILPDTRFLKILGWDDHYYRLIGSQFDPGFTGLILVMTFIYLESLNFAKKSKIWPAIKFIFNAGLIWAISLTFSRASYLCLWFSLLMLQIKKIRKSSQSYLLYALYFAISIFTIFTAAKPAGEGVNLSRTASITARISNIQTNINLLNGVEWLTGQGLFVSQTADRELIWQDVPYHANIADNIIIFILKSTGGVGLTLSLVLLIKYAIKLFKKDYFVFTSLIAVLIHSLFNASLLQNFIMLFLIGGVASVSWKKGE